jgi:hypothetical protein
MNRLTTFWAENLEGKQFGKHGHRLADNFKMRFEVPTAGKMSFMVFWVAVSCSFVGAYQHFGALQP